MSDRSEFVMPWMADFNSESKRASNECATEGEHRSKCNIFGVLKEDLNNSSASCDPS